MKSIESKISDLFAWDQAKTTIEIDRYIRDFRENEESGSFIARKILQTLLSEEKYEVKWKSVKALLLEYMDSISMENQIFSFAAMGGEFDPSLVNFINSTIYLSLHLKYLETKPENVYLESEEGLAYPSLNYSNKRVLVNTKSGKKIEEYISVKDLGFIYDSYPMLLIHTFVVKKGNVTHKIEVPSNELKSSINENLFDLQMYKKELCDILSVDEILEHSFKFGRSKEVINKVIETLLKINPSEIESTNLSDLLNPDEYSLNSEFDTMQFEIFEQWLDRFSQYDLEDLTPRLAEALGFRILKSSLIVDALCRLERVKGAEVKLERILQKLHSSVNQMKSQRTQEKYWRWYSEIERLRDLGHSIKKACESIAEQEYENSRTIRTRYHEKKKLADTNPNSVPIKYKKYET